jgi:hypothetical protein
MKSMLLISSILHDIQLLPFFLRHYRSRGVTRFVFHVWRGRENPLWPQILDETAGFDTELLTGDAGVFNGEADAVLCDAARQRFVAGDQWYVVPTWTNFTSFREMSPSIRLFTAPRRRTARRSAEPWLIESQ